MSEFGPKRRVKGEDLNSASWDLVPNQVRYYLGGKSLLVGGGGGEGGVCQILPHTIKLPL